MTLQLSAEDKLKRFLYLSNCHGAFTTFIKEEKVGKLDDSILLELIGDNKAENLINILTQINKDQLFIKRNNLSFVIAIALNSEAIPLEEKLKIRDAALNLCKNDEDFFNIIKYYSKITTKKNKFPKPLRKLAIQFYQNKDPMEFAKCVTRVESYHGWKHGDILKLCHIKFTDALSKDLVLKYAIFRNLVNIKYTEGCPVADLIRKSYELKMSDDIEKSVNLITELHANYKQVNSKLLGKELIWSALIPEMPVSQLLYWLPKFYKLNLLKNGSLSQSKVIDVLSDINKVSSTNLHPVEIYIHMKNFEKGGKPMDPHLVEFLNKKKDSKTEIVQNEIKCPVISNQLNKCLMLCYRNVHYIGKKIVIAIDITDKMNEKCFHNKNVTALEASYALLRWFMKVENHLTIGVFRDNEFHVVDMSKAYTFQLAVETLRQVKSSYCVINAPINANIKANHHVDIFINLLSSSSCLDAPKELRDKIERPVDSLNRYRKKMKSPNTKLVNIFLTSNNSIGTDGSRGILDILGFTTEVPRILEAFCRGHFC